jgi:hypothetical protein
MGGKWGRPDLRDLQFLSIDDQAYAVLEERKGDRRNNRGSERIVSK